MGGTIAQVKPGAENKDVTIQRDMPNSQKWNSGDTFLRVCATSPQSSGLLPEWRNIWSRNCLSFAKRKRWCRAPSCTLGSDKIYMSSCRRSSTKEFSFDALMPNENCIPKVLDDPLLRISAAQTKEGSWLFHPKLLLALFRTSLNVPRKISHKYKRMHKKSVLSFP